MKIHIKKFKEFANNNGCLVPFYVNEHFKSFKIKRFFFLHGIKNKLRANHAHKKCNQIIIPIKGSANIEIITKSKKKLTFIISKKNRNYLFIPKMNWVRVKFIKKETALLVLCDYKFEKKEYIRNIKKFIN